MGQLLGVVCRHALYDRFQNDALRRVGYHFSNIVDFNAVLFQVILVQRDFFLVPPDMVRFPNDQCVKDVLRGVGQHQPELLPVIVPAGLRPVAVFMDNGLSASRRVFLRLGQLAFNRLPPCW